MTETNTTPTPPEAPLASSRAKQTLFLAVMILICLLGVLAYGYQQLSQMNTNLVNTFGAVKVQVENGQQQWISLQKSVSDLQKTNEKSQTLTAQQENVMAAWRAAEQGDLNKWHLAEAQYLVKLANDHLQFSHDVSLARILLQQAEASLQNTQDPNALDIRKAIAADIVTLQNLPSVDITTLYTRVTALDAQIDQLPLPKNALKTDSTPIAVAKDLSWWRASLEYAWQGLNKIVIVRKNVTGVLPLVLPEEKTFLYQNMHAQMESVIWSLLQRNQTIYQESLKRLLTWIPLYFDQDAQTTKTFSQGLVALQAVDIQPATMNLADTLKLFDQVTPSKAD